ncbi:glycosyltransferase [Microvirga aerilata]|uniref:Glycosyltransferase n=1 Tax=Microvirga aerilata TaxID=670292 RepID=A0A936Z955_9HYPH|nr:glycosyltransferase [Microvirga aerilata]MBL0405067.1 glycosyltransferase [Microvirga aerilata]
MTSDQKFDAITAIAVIESRMPSQAVFQSLETVLAQVAVDHEIVVIANDVTSEIAQKLREITEAVPNVTVHFLAQRVDRETAVLAGIDHALGDWLVVLTPTEAEVTSLLQVLERAGPYEVVFAGAREPGDIPAVYRRTARLYFRLYEIFSGSSIDWPAPRIRVYSRAAARHLASLLDGEFALRSLNFSGTFPGTRETVTGLPLADLELPSPSYALRKALRGLLNASAMPLRAVIGTAVLTGGVAVISSLYAVLTYMLKENVAPGWTTLSLQISMMMLLFSVMFALIAEYVLKVYRSIAPRRRITVVRELRSPLRRQSDRLNVIDSAGSFQLGAPPEATPVTSKSEHTR